MASQQALTPPAISPRQGDTSLKLPDSRLIEDFGKHVQDGMTALYQIHTVLVNNAERNSGDRDLLSAFRADCAYFHDFCKRSNEFLQRSFNIVGDYQILSDSLVNHKGTPSDILSMARNMGLDINSLVKELRSTRSLVNAFLDFLKRVPRSQRLDSILQKSSQAGRAQRQGTQDDQDILDRHRFLQAAVASARPDGVAALRRALEEFQHITSILEQLEGFWIVTRTSLSEQTGRVRSVSLVVDPTARTTWSNYRRALLDAMATVREASDAFTIDPAPAMDTSARPRRYDDQIPRVEFGDSGPERRPSPFDDGDTHENCCGCTIM